MPGLIVIAPYSAADAKGLLKAAIRSEDPVVFLENELLYGQSFDVPKLDDYVAADRQGAGRHARARTSPWSAIRSASASRSTRRRSWPSEGIDAEVIDLRTLRPLDKATVLASLAKTNRMVCVEEGWPVCSISSELMAIAMEEGFDDLDAPVLRVTDEDVPLPYAANLEKLALIKVDDVVAAAQEGLLPLSARDARRRPPARARLRARRRARPRVEALWRLDVTLGAVLATGREPMVSRIRLAWWREALERLDREPPPAEPVLQALAAHVLPAG